jgi:alkylation response protein AidB-like acyl-CoA dehydrogenase
VLLAAGTVGLRNPGGPGALVAWGRLLRDVGETTTDGSFPLLLSLYAGVAESVAQHAGPALRASHAEPAVRGERLMAFAYTEEAEVFELQTRAVADGDSLRVSGEKRLVTGAMQADAYVVYARDERDDVVAVVVDRDDDGVRVEPRNTSGARAAGLARLNFADVRVPRERLLVRADALSHVQAFLNRRRLLLCCAPIGRMRGLVREVTSHLRDRRRAGQPVLTLSNVQARIGRMEAATRNAETLAFAVLARCARGELDPYWDPDVVAAKHLVTELAQQVADECLRVAGGDGYDAEYGFERAQRDFAGLLAGAGAQDLLEIGLGAFAASGMQ